MSIIIPTIAFQLSYYIHENIIVKEMLHNCYTIYCGFVLPGFIVLKWQQKGIIMQIFEIIA